jgi:hypothetical protein
VESALALALRHRRPGRGSAPPRGATPKSSRRHAMQSVLLVLFATALSSRFSVARCMPTPKATPPLSLLLTMAPKPSSLTCCTNASTMSRALPSHPQTHPPRDRPGSASGNQHHRMTCLHSSAGSLQRRAAKRFAKAVKVVPTC